MKDRSGSRALWPAVLLAALLPWLLLWPLPAVMGSAMVTSPLSEGPAHLWGWWAALHEGRLFDFHTALLNFPDGQDLALIDPSNALVFALFSWAGPDFAFNMVLVVGVFAAGLGGGLLAREAGAESPILGVVIGASAPTVLAVAADGITEGVGVGWVAVQLALLLSLRRDARPVRVALLVAAIVFGACSGPYNALFIAILDVPVALFMLQRSKTPLVAGGLSVLLCWPYLSALSARAEGLPGSASRAGLGLPAAANPWRAGFSQGTDLLDLFVPAPLTGAFSDLPHTAYLGVVTLSLAFYGAWKLRKAGERAWPWLLGATVFGALALGPWLSVGGHFPTVGDRPLLGPAGMLALFTPLGRITRWYRAGAVAVLLLAPLASRAVKGRALWIAAPLVLLDARLLAPLPLAFPTIVVPESLAMAALDGPVVELPQIHPMFREGQTADLNLLLQVRHGQPSSGALHAQDMVSLPSLADLRRLAAGQVPGDGQELGPKATRALARRGFRWLAVYRSFFPESGLAALRAALGPPTAEDDLALVWRIAVDKP